MAKKRAKVKPTKKAPKKSAPKSKKSAPRARSPKRNSARGVSKRPRAKPPSTRRAATRKKKIDAQRIAESLRASERAVASKKGAKVRKRRRRAREQRGKIEARVIEAGPRATAVYETLVAALDRMAASSGLELEVRGAPDEGKTPWLVQGAFISDGSLTYDDLAAIFSTWENDYTLEATIGPRRVSWIRWEVLQRGKREGFAPGGIGEWGRVISEARQSADELLERYQGDKNNGRIFEVQVYFSATAIGGRTIRL